MQSIITCKKYAIMLFDCFCKDTIFQNNKEIFLKIVYLEPFKIVLLFMFNIRVKIYLE